MYAPGVFRLRWLLLGCGVAACQATAPAPSPSAVPPQSADSAPASSPDPAPPAGESAAAPETGAPPSGEDERPAVDPSLNERYAEQTDVDHYVSQFEREGREVHDRRSEIIAALGLEKGDDVADVGAGTGLFTFDIARAVGKDGTVFAVDVQAYFLEHIRATAKERGLDNVETVRASQRTSGLAPDSVDLVFMSDAYHHIEYPRSYLADLSRALRPGGRLVIVDYIKGDDRPKWLQQHIRATPEEFRAEIEAAGYHFERSEPMLEENFFFVFSAPN